MPRNEMNKDELKCYVLKLKHQIDSDLGWYPGEKDVAQKYLNKVLDKIQEYRC
jgi:ribosomal protein S20